MCLRSRPWTALHSPDDPIWAPFLELAEFNSIPPWTSLECLGKALSEFIQKLPHRYSGVLLLKQINHQSSVPSSVCVWEAVPIARVAAPTEDSWLKEMEVWRKKRGTYRGGQSEVSGFLLILRESERWYFQSSFSPTEAKQHLSKAVSFLYGLQTIQMFRKSQLSDLSAVRMPEKDQMI